MSNALIKEADIGIRDPETKRQEHGKITKVKTASKSEALAVFRRQYAAHKAVFDALKDK